MATDGKGNGGGIGEGTDVVGGGVVTLDAQKIDVSIDWAKRIVTLKVARGGLMLPVQIPVQIRMLKMIMATVMQGEAAQEGAEVANPSGIITPR